MASKKNLTDIEFKKKFKEDTEISIKISNTSKNIVYEKPRTDKVVSSQIEHPENMSSSFDDEINELKNQPGIISSPMVGTVYLQPEPGANKFVNIGDSVKSGQTILIVEAMKTMNPIESSLQGKVIKILVENEQAVEFGQPVMLRG